MSKIYTKTGDKGETGLVGGRRIRKSAPRVEAYGTVDELNSWIGLLRAELPAAAADQEALLASIQHRLFSCSSYLATPDDAREQYHITLGISEEHVRALEEMIDRLDEVLPPFKFFILPAGSRAASVAHLARTVARRTERAVYRFLESDPEATVDPLLLQYLNRLSDYLFSAARLLLRAEGKEEVRWDPEA